MLYFLCKKKRFFIIYIIESNEDQNGQHSEIEQVSKELTNGQQFPPIVCITTNENKKKKKKKGRQHQNNPFLHIADMPLLFL